MKKILIVDDEENVLTVLGQRLEGAGYTVLKATTGRQALAIANEEIPNLIILDVFLPDFDGGEVSQMLRDRPDTRNIPTIFLTCLFTKQEEQHDGHRIGGDIFVSKPYNHIELLDLIRKNIR